MSSTAKSSSVSSSKQQQQRWKDEKYDKQARAFRLDMDCRHRQYLHQTHQQQQERHHNNSKRNDMSTTRVRERAEARAGGGGGGEEPRDRPPVSFHYHIQQIKNTNGSVVVSNLRRRTSIRRVTNGNKDGSTNSNKAHTVPFRIEIPSSCVFLFVSTQHLAFAISLVLETSRAQL